MPEQRWHVVLNYTCIFFVILYELLFGETGVRPVFALALWGGQGLEMFLAKGHSVFSQVSLALLISSSTCSNHVKWIAGDPNTLSA